YSWPRLEQCYPICNWRVGSVKPGGQGPLNQRGTLKLALWDMRSLVPQCIKNTFLKSYFIEAHPPRCQGVTHEQLIQQTERCLCSSRTSRHTIGQILGSLRIASKQELEQVCY